MWMYFCGRWRDLELASRMKAHLCLEMLSFEHNRTTTDNAAHEERVADQGQLHSGGVYVTEQYLKYIKSQLNLAITPQFERLRLHSQQQALETLFNELGKHTSVNPLQKGLRLNPPPLLATSMAGICKVIISIDI